MKIFYAILQRLVLGILIATPFAFSGTGQTTAPQPPAAAKKKPTSATPQMIDEAIQRSQARTAKEQSEQKPEQFGSEEPFTYGKMN